MNRDTVPQASALLKRFDFDFVDEPCNCIEDFGIYYFLNYKATVKRN